jgi:hypothetical protein
MKLQRPPLNLLLPLLAISILATISFAAGTATITNTSYQSDNGVYFNLVGGFSAASNGFNVVSTTAAASANPCPWANLGTCQTALTAGHWQYSVTLTLLIVPASTTSYTFTVNWNTGSGYTLLGSIVTSVPTTAVVGNTMTFLIDTGVTSIAAPVGITVTVA